MGCVLDLIELSRSFEYFVIIVAGLSCVGCMAVIFGAGGVGLNLTCCGNFRALIANRIF